MEKYYEKIMRMANESGMLVLYHNIEKYVLVAGYHDSQSGKVCGVKHSFLNAQDGFFPKFKRFFFDSTFNKVYCFIVDNDDENIYRSYWENKSSKRYLFGGKRKKNGCIESAICGPLGR